MDSSKERIITAFAIIVERAKRGPATFRMPDVKVVCPLFHIPAAFFMKIKDKGDG